MNDIKHCKYAVPAAPTWVYANDRTLRVSEWAVFENGAVLPVVGDRVVRNGLMPVRVVNRLVMTITEKYKQDYSIVLQVVEAADNASKAFDLPREFILAVIATESSFNPMATSRLGAQGLMQIHHTSGLTPTYDIHENIMVASGFLKGLIERKGVEGALSHYNAGYKGSRTYPKKVLAEVEQFI